MAEMSKTLATIDINAPVTYEFEEAKLGNFYTEEAYVLCKQLEFKNMLKRFEIDVPQNDISTHF